MSPSAAAPTYADWLRQQPNDDSWHGWQDLGISLGYIGRDRPDEPPERDEKVSAQSTPVRTETKRLPFRTGREIAKLTPEKPVCIFAFYGMAGATTEIVGKVKAGGKTTFMMHACRAVVEGHSFLGQPTIQTPVVYLTEQPPASLREALRRADLLDRDDFALLSWRDTIGLTWPEVVAAAVAECRARGARLLVVDTLGQFAGLRGEGENASGQAQEAMEPLQAAAAEGLAVVVVRHERKSGGDVGESGRGSSAFAGAVDIVVSIRRGDGNTRPGIRVLSALSRFDETPDTLVVELTPDGYIALGDEAAVALMEARERLRDVLPAKAPGLTAAELGELLPGVGRSTVQRAMESLIEAGEVIRTGEGKRGHPYRFLSAQLEGEVGAETKPATGSEEAVEPSPFLSAHTPKPNGAETNDLARAALVIFADDLEATA